jgi:hypothetical protein
MSLEANRKFVEDTRPWLLRIHKEGYEAVRAELPKEAFRKLKSMGFLNRRLLSSCAKSYLGLDTPENVPAQVEDAK